MFLLLALAATPRIALASAGQLDPNFGTNGIFATTFNNSSPVFATCVALQANGQIIVGGEAGNPGVVLRLNTNGTLDTSFASAGIFSIRFRDVENFTVGVAVQTDGKILAVGTGLPQGGQLIRLNTNGSFDPSFGTGGSVSLALTPSALALQPDGNIIVGGAIAGQGTRVMTRFTTTGALDTTFGNGGTAAVVSNLSSLALQPDGKILVGSGSLLVSAESSGTLSRYNSNGSVDTIFGIQGQVADLAGPAAIGLESNGQIVSAGSITSSLSPSGNGTGFGLTGYFSTGFPVFLFGTHGGAITPFPGFANAGASSMAVQSNNFIVAAGQAAVSPSSSVFALARYIPGGQLDGSFGSGGLVTTSFGNGTSASIAAIAVQTDGKIVTVGQASNSGLVVARYLGQ